MKRGTFVGLVVACILLASCGLADSSAIGVRSAVFTEADAACVDFYRSAQTSVEEEAVYMRVFADRIADLGYDDAAVVLSDLADQWEVGVWEAGQDEVWQSALWAEAGEMLGAAGAIRCVDLAEWWGIDGYNGEPNPKEMLTRQAGIWVKAGLDDYFLLVAMGVEGGNLTQIHVKVEDGQPTSVSEVASGSIDVKDLPLSVDEVYSMLLNRNASHIEYNLVLSAPRLMHMADGREIIVVVDTEHFPEPIQEYDVPEGEQLG